MNRQRITSMKKTGILLAAISCFPGMSTVYSQCPDGMITSENNLIVNGDFSLGNAFFESDYIFSSTAICQKDKILAEGYYAITTNPHSVHCDFVTCGDHTSGSGPMMVVNGDTNRVQVVWKQRVQIHPYSTYYFSAWIANAVSQAPSHLEFSINGKALGDPIIAPASPGVWRQFFTTWTSGNEKEAEISIVNRNTIAYGNDFMLDDLVFYFCTTPDFDQSLDSAQSGSVVEMRNVFFNTGSFVLRQDSYTQLQTLVSYLKKKTSWTIEIRGHTDNTGNAADNMTLSEKRARAVYNYLVSAGINKKRMTFTGLGQTQPVASNETIEGRQKNRRVEFRIVKM